MKRNLTEQEKNFIQQSLEYSDKKDYSPDKNKITEKEKQSNSTKKKKGKKPGYKNPVHWIGAFLALPILLSGIFLLFVIRAENFLGKDALDYFSKNNMAKTMAESQPEYEWLPFIVQVYEFRWVIIIGLFVLCFIIAGLIMLYDIKYNNNNSENDNNETDTTIEEK